jgi:hypothetical protein
MDRPGRGAKDRLELAGGTVVDVAGNVAEHTRDVWNLLDGDPCWAPGVLENPVCTMPTRSSLASGVHTVVGGSWAASAAMTAAATRVPGLDFELVRRDRRLRDQLAPVLAGVGFRCARSGR